MWQANWPYWNGFLYLTRRRPLYVGLGGVIPGALQYTELVAYARDHGFTHPDDLDEFIQLVDALDIEYLKLQADSREKK